MDFFDMQQVFISQTQMKQMFKHKETLDKAVPNETVMCRR